MYDEEQKPWAHPHWYDLHDGTATAGGERESEHYRELVLALPPLREEDHLVDIGSGTGKLAAMVGEAYPNVGRVSLVDPNSSMLEKAHERVSAVMTKAKVDLHVGTIGFQHPWLPARPATIVVVGSVLMPTMLARRGSLEAGASWVASALQDILDVGIDGTQFFFLETIAMDFVDGAPKEPVRRLKFAELREALVETGYLEVDCVYRFRDRVVFSARRGSD